MRQLTFEGARSARWREAAGPALTSDTGALVRADVVATCDMDAVAMSGLIRFRAGTPLGHEGVGTVVEVGDAVTGFREGDVVIIPWQISCGVCDRCRRGQDTHCKTVPPGSCYGWGPQVRRWGGFLADVVEVPFADHMLVPLPPGLDARVAVGLSDNVVDAWRSVGPPLRTTGGGRVLVMGGTAATGGSIGLYAAAFAVGLGAEETVFVSPDADLCAKAIAYGARSHRLNDEPDDLGTFEVTVDTSGTTDALAFAVRSTAPHGICTCTAGAVHRGRQVPLPVYEMYMNSVTFRTGWVPTRAVLDEPLRHMTENLFDPRQIASTTIFADAEAAFTEPFTKLILIRNQ
jgi:alcohol dehydrogenase